MRTDGDGDDDGDGNGDDDNGDDDDDDDDVGDGNIMTQKRDIPILSEQLPNCFLIVHSPCYWECPPLSFL